VTSRSSRAPERAADEAARDEPLGAAGATFHFDETDERILDR
jgi:hypothetical protein